MEVLFRIEPEVISCLLRMQREPEREHGRRVGVSPWALCGGSFPAFESFHEEPVGGWVSLGPGGL